MLLMKFIQNWKHFENSFISFSIKQIDSDFTKWFKYINVKRQQLLRVLQNGIVKFVIQTNLFQANILKSFIILWAYAVLYDNWFKKVCISNVIIQDLRQVFSQIRNLRFVKLLREENFSNIHHKFLFKYERYMSSISF